MHTYVYMTYLERTCITIVYCIQIPSPYTLYTYRLPIYVKLCSFRMFNNTDKIDLKASQIK